MTMLRRTPLSRGSGFKRAVIERRPTPPPRPATRRATYAGTTAAPIPKEDPVVCEAYRRLVRQLPCDRCGIEGYTQFCHADEGKGMGLKTDDRRGWPGCGPHGDTMGCHHEVGTSGSLPREEKRAYEEAAGARTRVKIQEAGLWPKGLEFWPTD